MRLQNDEKYWHSVRAWIDLHCIAWCRNTGTSHHKLHAIGSEIAIERLLLIECIYSFHEQLLPIGRHYLVISSASCSALKISIQAANL